MKTNTVAVPTSIALYSPERIGISMEVVGTDFVKLQEKEIQTQWFRSHETETDIIIWYDPDGKIIKQQINHMGVVVEWNVLEGVRTGILFDVEIHPATKKTQTEEEATEAVSESVQYDKTPQKQSLFTATEIIKHSKCIGQGLKLSLFKNFSQVSTEPTSNGWLSRVFKRFFK
jgi:hypothetical protein